MKDEIKEKMTIGKAKKILRGFLAKDCYYDTPLYYAIPYLLDYITNLQNENMKYDQCLTELTDNYKDLQKELTNLQEENERLKEELLSKPDNEITLETADGQRMTIIQSERINMQEKLNKSLEELYKKYNDYKTRNEKAIEYIDDNTYYKDHKGHINIDDVYMILQGSDE